MSIVSTITSESGNSHNYIQFVAEHFSLRQLILHCVHNFRHTRNVIESQVMFLTHVSVPVALFSALVLLESLW